MKKSLLVLFVLCAVAVMSYAASVAITFPAAGSQLVLKSGVSITWSYSGYSASSLVKLVLFKGGTSSGHKVGNVAQNLTLGSGAYSWQAGEYSGGFAGAGTDYYLKIVSVNGDFNDFSDAFSIVLPKIPIEKFHEYTVLNPDPGCPMCGVFDIGALLAKLGNPPPDVIGSLVLLRNGRQVGLLGKLGSGGLLPTEKVKLRFPADDFALIGQANQGFEVAILGESGKILKRQAISLKLGQ